MNRLNLQPNVQLWMPGSQLSRRNLSRAQIECEHSSLPKVLVIDLRLVKEVDSNGLAWLVNLKIAMDDLGHTMLLLKPSYCVQSLLKRALVWERLLIISSVKDIRHFLQEYHGNLSQTRLVSGH